MDFKRASFAVFFSGVLAILLCIKYVNKAIYTIVPICIQIAVFVGIGILTAINGAYAVDLLIESNSLQSSNPLVFHISTGK